MRHDDIAMRMTYTEREHLKHFDFGDQAGEVLVMIAHWHRQSKAIPFSLYAANWAAAETRRDVSRLRAAWPLQGPRMIGDNYSDWNSYNQPGYKTSGSAG